MGLLKKIFKPVSKVLDKVIPNEIKPALPYLAAFAPVFGPTAGMFGSTMAKRALLSGGANIFAQLAQEGNEGDINLLSAGLGALTGAMTVPGTGAGAVNPVDEFGVAGKVYQPGSAEIFRSKAAEIGTDTLRGKGLEALAKGSDIFAAGAADPFSKAGIKAAALPAATATGDVMEAEARRLNKQAIIDEALGGLEEGFSNADASNAIRLAMLQYGFSDDEISETITAAGYKVGGRVGYRFGGIDAALDKVEDEDIKESVKMVADMPDMDLMDLIEEFEITFKRKPMSMEELKQFYRENYEMESPIKLKEKIKEKVTIEAKDGGLMNLGGKEMDLRGGGFVPIGKKEKADDVPARLSKNEFVMTADAVRAAGGGSINKGAKRMYNLMNTLEARA